MNRFKQILYVADCDNNAEVSLQRAVALAEANQARLAVVAVSPGIRAYIGLPGGANPAALQAAVTEDLLRQLASLVEPYGKRIEIETGVLHGTPFLEIVREVLRAGHDLVIKSPDRQDFLDRLLGSDDMHLLRKCPCPVWLIKSGAPRTFKRILAAVDVDDVHPPDESEGRRRLNHQILELAGSLAVTESAELHVVHTWDAPAIGIMRGAFLRASEKEVADYVERTREHHSRALKALLREVAGGEQGGAMGRLEPKTHLLKGWAHERIPALSAQIGVDLIVMGTVASTGIPGFIMGNTAETILGQIDCSVLAVKPPGFVTPVELLD